MYKLLTLGVLAKQLVSAVASVLQNTAIVITYLYAVVLFFVYEYIHIPMQYMKRSVRIYTLHV